VATPILTATMIVTVQNATVQNVATRSAVVDQIVAVPSAILAERM